VAYGLVFLILVLCGLGLPLPEDVSLILGGFLAYSGAVHVEAMVVTGFLGILAGDSIIFFAGRRIGRNLNPDSWIGKHVTPEKLGRVEGLFQRWGQKIVMAARFMPGVRAPVYFSAGTSGIPYYRFILFDGLAACLSAPLFVLCGKHFGGQITEFIHLARRAQGLVFTTVLLLATLFFFVQRRRLRREAKPEVQPQPVGAAEPVAEAVDSAAPAPDSISAAK
jgi:membrane protein DedA with SNARE-associated domain